MNSGWTCRGSLLRVPQAEKPVSVGSYLEALDGSRCPCPFTRGLLKVWGPHFPAGCFPSPSAPSSLKQASLHGALLTRQIFRRPLPPPAAETPLLTEGVWLDRTHLDNLPFAIKRVTLRGGGHIGCLKMWPAAMPAFLDFEFIRNSLSTIKEAHIFLKNNIWKQSSRNVTKTVTGC